MRVKLLWCYINSFCWGPSGTPLPSIRGCRPHFENTTHLTHLRAIDTSDIITVAAHKSVYLDLRCLGRGSENWAFHLSLTLSLQISHQPEKWDEFRKRLLLSLSSALGRNLWCFWKHNSTGNRGAVIKTSHHKQTALTKRPNASPLLCNFTAYSRSPSLPLLPFFPSRCPGRHVWKHKCCRSLQWDDSCLHHGGWWLISDSENHSRRLIFETR